MDPDDLHLGGLVLSLNLLGDAVLELGNKDLLEMGNWWLGNQVVFGCSSGMVLGGSGKIVRDNIPWGIIIYIFLF